MQLNCLRRAREMVQDWKLNLFGSCITCRWEVQQEERIAPEKPTAISPHVGPQHQLDGFAAQRAGAVDPNLRLRRAGAWEDAFLGEDFECSLWDLQGGGDFKLKLVKVVVPNIAQFDTICNFILMSQCWGISGSGFKVPILGESADGWCVNTLILFKAADRETGKGLRQLLEQVSKLRFASHCDLSASMIFVRSSCVILQ